MKKKILMCIIAIFIIIPCMFLFSACDMNQTDNIQVRVGNEYVEWSSDGNNWNNIISIDEIKEILKEDGNFKGLKGDKGEDGADGNNIELRVGGGYIQWKVTSSSSWVNLMPISELKVKGDSGSSAYVWIKYADNQPTSNVDMKITASDWIGIYSGPSATAPTNYTSYTWYRIKGENGNSHTISISNDGYWIIDEQKSDTKAVGKDGKEYIIGQDGYWYLDGVKTEYKAVGIDTSYATYTVSFDYGASKGFFDNSIDSTTVKSIEWITNLPTIKNEYKEAFLGWVIENTNKQIESYDFIGGDVTLYAKFDFEKLGMSGLYQNGKYVMNWATLKSSLNQAIKTNSIVARTLNSSPYHESYFENIFGDLVIDNTITKIDSYAFYACHNLTTIVVPSSVTSIGNSTFLGCVMYSKIILPNSIKTIDRSAFSAETSLNFNIYENGKYIEADGNPYFYLVGIINNAESCIIHKDCRIIADYAFSFGYFTEIEIPSNIKRIPDFCFYCSHLRDVIIDEGVEVLGNAIFKDCTYIENISFPNSLREVGEYCVVFDSFTSVNNTHEGTSYYFGNSNNPYLIWFACEYSATFQKTAVVKDGCKFLEAGNSMYFSGYSSIIIPETVISIGYEAIASSVSAVYYGGTQTQWSDIRINERNKLNGATIYFYSESQPIEEGNFWHYDIDGITPIVW
ncbi:MAG: leucine-rich repeat protein [Clostridia bacterium]|nr:leucine-rich repeat protein [Clostridia bacterium]